MPLRMLEQEKYALRERVRERGRERGRHCL